MKHLLIAAHCLLLTASPLIAAQNPAPANQLDWSVKQTWKMDAEPLEFVQSLDNKKVFVLGSDSKVHVFTPTGTKIGSIPVDKNITSIDIAPRGETLYLINKTDKSYTALDVSVTQQIDTTGSPFLGNENAQVELVVFSDFQ
jgi:protein-disulfide isomerase